MQMTKDLMRRALAEIGRKGGKAGKGKAKLRRNSHTVARERWRSKHPLPKES